ncbi:MAG: indole-3-glycerol phosphate synthase TrpC [Gemmatimonadota bacterium]|nr:indole-3-glycerol phosphate synthase TrpC [Gemmatimonadota bacterium]MDE2873617.1 indole-3-glycerol phosphate synthase TrpC [Gemmatimonadota bacterium]
MQTRGRSVDRPRVASPGGRGGESSRGLPGILDRIVAGKRAEAGRLRALRRDLARAAEDAPPPRPFMEPLRRSGRVGVIAEVKRRSPGAGEIDPGLDPARLSAEYEAAGAFAISVLTDTAWFGGSLEDLQAVREGRGVPVLRKDFVIDAVQVTEARAAGADLVLLIVRILEPALLGDLRAMVHDMGMTALVEVHDEWEVDAALEAGAGLVGVNNRDLSVFRTDPAVTERLARYVPGEALLVSESGIRDAGDVARVAAAGADAVLVGEALVRSGSPGGLVGEMAAVRRLRARA